jgi:Relaxase/Mobilisation nuclease domain
MYIKGASRRSVTFWSKHLRDLKENDRAEIIDARGLADQNDLREMMREMQVDAELTRCQNFMYIASFNPPSDEHLTEEEWERAFEIFEKHRGIPEGQQRIVIEHEKNGRIHRHVVWNRIDLDNMRAFPDGLDLKACEAAEHEIERELGLRRTPHFLDRNPEDGKPRKGPKSYEMFRGMKSGLDPRDVTKEITALYSRSESAADFVNALHEHGYELVQGKRAFCILDPAGHEHSLARRIDGVNTKQLRAFLHDIDLSGLRTVDQAKTLYRERQIADLKADHATVSREIEWMDKLAAAARAKEAKERKYISPEDPIQPSRIFKDAAVRTTHKSRVSNLKEIVVPIPSVRRTSRLLAGALHTASDAFASLFSPTHTSEQMREAQDSTFRRQTEAEITSTLSQFTSDRIQQSQKHENESPRPRDDRDRDR